MIKRIQAKLHGIPYRFSNLWVAGKIYLRERAKGAESFDLLGVNRDNGRNNAVVPLLRKGDTTHFYRIVDAYCAPGDDHIISPWSFDFRYDHTETRHD